MINNPLISIITVCFNSERTIQRTFNSILNQSIKNFEYIIVDGKSSDNTINIINDYTNIFKDLGINTIVVSEKDNGIYDAMNKGIKLSNGQWLIFLNSDDWYLNNTVEIINKYINDKYDIICGGINGIKKINDKYYYRPITPELTKINLSMSLLHPATIIKKSVLEKFYFDTNFKIAGDWDLLKKLFNYNYRFLLINDILVNYMEDGISAKTNVKLRLEQYKIINSTNPIFAKIHLIKNLITQQIKNFIIIKRIKKNQFKDYIEFEDL